jgi:hypothetical protein
VLCFGVSAFTTLRNRLAVCLQPSIWQTVESDKRRQEHRARANERDCVHRRLPRIGASALHALLAILIGRLDRQERQAIAIVDE